MNTPKTLAERTSLANKCLTKLSVELPCLVDDMNNTADKAYQGWPDRLFVVDKQGKIVVRGERGPWGFKPSVDQAAKWLADQFPSIKPDEAKGS